MLMAGDLALASLQRYNDSLVEYLKHTMIEHETIFQWQVDLTQTSYQDCFRETPTTSHRVKPRPLDLQLPADDYTSHFDAELLQQSRKEDSWSPLKKDLKVGNFLDDHQIYVAEEVKPSPGAGKDARNQESRSRYTSLSGADVIDLDGSVLRTSHWMEEHSSSISPQKPSADIGGKSQFQVSAVQEEPGHWIFKNCALKDHEKRGHESVSPGLDDLHVACTSVNKCKRKSSDLCQIEFVDLNRVQLEESSWFTDAPSGTLPSPAASSSAVSQRLKSASHTMSTYSRKPNSDSGYTSDERRPSNVVYSTLTDAGGKDTSALASSRSVGLNANSRSKIGVIDLESLPEDLPELSDGINDTSIEAERTNDDLYQGQRSFVRHLHKMDDSKGSPDFKLVDSYLCKSVVVCPDIPQTAKDKEFGQESCEKSEEDTVSSSLCRSNVIQDECYRDTVGVSQVTETDSSQLDVVPKEVDCTCVNNGKSCQCGATKCRDPDVLPNEWEIDRLVAWASVSLLHISLGTSNCCEYSILDDGTERLMNEPKEKPQSSSDSFESIVLRQKNNSTDDYCVTSAPIDGNEIETEIKGPVASLRRGRRLKDFQRDVLPDLVSLSRHEICEDLHSIGGIVRANDFRKSRIKKGSSQYWFQPSRSRRSRFNNIC
ncbi:hypothetical protein Sjap_020425 [Stephania japonica]|uniref:Uncharacterized protein n=1 Tax=Stephania japonica TaxID=461633 RepID=A0AAP0I098_9MAGN